MAKDNFKEAVISIMDENGVIAAEAFLIARGYNQESAIDYLRAIWKEKNPLGANEELKAESEKQYSFLDKKEPEVAMGSGAAESAWTVPSKDSVINRIVSFFKG